MKRLALISCLAVSVFANAQFDSGGGSNDTRPSEGPLANLFANMTARSIGPVNMGGRIMDISVYEKDPRIFFVASASGGVFKTENDGLTFTPIFDKEGSISMGAVAVCQSNPDILWIGTGEQSSRNSAAWGDGAYKSIDGGKTWAHMGLTETMHISKVYIDPKNPDHVLVGALGRLWGPNKERGLYRTTDGGKTWTTVLDVDENSGIIDLAVDPKNPRNMLCATWQRLRKPYDMVSGGPGSGLWKSTDGGDHWRKITKGIPNQTLGRIGLSYFHDNPKIVIASIEHGLLPGEKKPSGRSDITDTGGGIYQSTDGGESWKRVTNRNPRPFYFSMPRQDPKDVNTFYMPGVDLNVTSDLGKTFKTIAGRVHSDYHAFWINPQDHDQILIGCDGGIYESRDMGKTWQMKNTLAIGQFYAVAYDMRKPYWVYGGLQDNGSWGIPTQTTHNGVAFFDAISVGGGDGFHVQVDPDDWGTVYSESQGGAVSRTDVRTGGSRFIRPREANLRFNWSTPIELSPWSSKTVYVGSNKLFRSSNRGDNWDAISPDLTTNDPEKMKAGDLSVSPERTGAENYCTIISISESPRRQGLIYVGTDDGLVQKTEDAGKTWVNLTANIPGVPANTWCSRVIASKWVDGRVYALFDGHRSNDFKPYAFVSEDFGKTWNSLAAGLPDFDCLYVIREGEKNQDLLYLGSEKSLRFSLDRGATWTRFRQNFPTVAVHDLKVHPRELDLIIATHGRSLWTLDVSALEGMSKGTLSQDVAIFKPQNVYFLGRGAGNWFGGDGVFTSGNSQPGTKITYYLKQPVSGEVTLTVGDAGDISTTDLETTNKAGLNIVSWNGRIDGRNVAPGDYRVVLTAGGKSYVTSVHVEDASLTNN
jgi:photosystem II stability/assembly factor-like uncharacterized protein